MDPSPVQCHGNLLDGENKQGRGRCQEEEPRAVCGSWQRAGCSWQKARGGSRGGSLAAGQSGNLAIGADEGRGSSRQLAAQGEAWQLGNWATGQLGEAKRKEHSAWRKQQRLAGSGQLTEDSWQRADCSGQLKAKLGNLAIGQFGDSGRTAGAKLGDWAIWQLGNLEPLIVPSSAGLPDRLIAFLWRASRLGG